MWALSPPTYTRTHALQSEQCPIATANGNGILSISAFRGQPISCLNKFMLSSWYCKRPLLACSTRAWGGTKDGWGRGAHLASSPSSTTLLTLQAAPSPSMISWKMVNASVPVNARCTGEEVPGVLVYSSCHLPSSKSGLVVGLSTPCPGCSSLATASSSSCCCATDSPSLPLPATSLIECSTAASRSACTYKCC